jgi:hypothetical protein
MAETLKTEYICEKVIDHIKEIRFECHSQYMKQDKKLSGLLEYVNRVLVNYDLFIANPPNYDDILPNNDTEE